LNNITRAFSVYNGELYAGGWFTQAGSIAANRISKWDGSNWFNVGVGTDSIVQSLAVYKCDLFAGGYFNNAGGNASSRIAKWSDYSSLPQMSVTSTSSVICTSESATLSVSGASTYTWSTGSNNLNIVISPTVTTSYTVNGTTANSCPLTSTFTQSVNACIGIQKYNLKDVRIYPNPSCNVINIEDSQNHFINSDLSVINQVKEIILSSNDNANMYANILQLLGHNSDKSHYFSINIFDKFYPVLHTYALNSQDKKVVITSDPCDEDLFNSFRNFKGDILEFETDKKRKDLFALLHQPVNDYSSAVIFPIANAAKTYGFFCFYSLQRNIYTEDTMIMVKDIATSLASYFMQYEQNQIIENYSEQLEILNESKTKLMSYNNLNDVYAGIIELLSDKIENVMRVSILVHDLEKNAGHLFFKDPETGLITNKFISTHNVPTIPYHLKGAIYEKPDFRTSSELTDEDKLWMSRGARSVISLPVTINGKLFASVNLLSQISGNFNDQHKALIKEINESAGTVIEQLQFKEIISRKNKDISDNITYARRIQSALMPTEELLKEILPESFLIFNQRDSLGGDFYWFEKRDENIFFAVGDCTGHGVSGSLLTILASDYIKQAVEGKGYTDPALILEYLSSALQGTLNKYSEDEILDGLDISFGIYNSNTKILLFSSAIHHFFLARNNELIEYKGNRKAIGGVNTDAKENNFTTYMIQLESNDVVYFTTDGFTDQLESKTEKRYGKARLKQMLLQINDKDINEQKEILLKEHLKWKGNQTQTDDICMLGFKIK